jgi:hypothetical protein
MKFRSAIITAASGSVGGATFSTNKGGNYVRARVKGTQPNSAAQVQVRQNMAVVTAAWQELTDVQRQAWRDAAQSATYQNTLGETKTLTGQNLFVKINGNVKAANPTAAIILQPVSPTAMAIQISGYTVENDGGSAISTIAGSVTTGASKFVQVFIAENQSPGIQSVKPSAFKKFLGQEADNGNLSTLLTTALNATQSTPIVGRKWWLYILLTDTDTGATLKSNLVSATVTAA